MPFVPDPKRIEVVSDEIAAKLRTMTPAEKVAMVSTAGTVLFQLVLLELTRQHPDWSEERVRSEASWRLMPRTKFTSYRPIPEGQTYYTADDREPPPIYFW